MKLVQSVLSIFIGAVFFGLPASAQVQTAGNLLVNIDPSSQPLGPIASIPNAGTLGGAFAATGLIDVDQPVVVAVGGGSKAIMFDGHNFMEHVTAPGGAAQPAPANLVGANPQCSIEAWVINPTIFAGDVETVVSWGTRDNGTLLSFGYGSEGNHGAVDHWGANLGWHPVPAAAQWHHLVYTYDGTTTRIYADGALNGTLAAAINTGAGQPITIAAERVASGALAGWGGSRGSLSVGKLRIHSGVLTVSQVANNYNTEKASFVFGPTPLAAKPTHRYSFNNTAAADAVGATVADTGTTPSAAALVQGAAGTAAFTGTKLHLNGGPSATAAYVDLPNGLLSQLTANGGATGPGQITLEGWLQVTGNQTWQRYFDFGDGSAGEITGPGGDAQGVSYFALMQNGGARDWARLDLVNNGFGGGPSSGTTRDFGNENGNAPYGMTHYAATWNESTGEIIVYENGLEVTRTITDKKFNHVDDVNVWLGRSNWTGDANLQGDYDEFRVYNRVLSPAEVANNYIAGADAVAVEPGNLVALRLQLPKTNYVTGAISQLTVFGDFQNVTNVNVTTRTNLTFRSGNTNVATISSTGLINAIAPGTVDIIGTYGSISSTQNLTISPITATLKHRYSFNETAGSATVTDSVGGASGNGTLQGNATLTGSNVALDGGASYVELPPHLIDSPTSGAITFEAWASFGVNQNWARLWDFGDQAGNNAHTTFFLAPHDGGGNVNVTFQGESGARFVTRPGTLDNQNNVHLVATVNPDTRVMSLYVNGALAATRTDEDLPISTVNNLFSWLGRSLYANDPYLIGSIDEFRIYDGTLTRDKIALDAAVGPNQIITDPGALQSVSATVTNQLLNGTTAQATFTGTFANAANVNLFAYGAPTITSGNNNVVTVDTNGLVRAVSPGSTTLTFNFGGKSAQQTVTVAVPAATLKHRYSFNDDGSFTATDSAAGPSGDGTLVGTATIAGGKLVLDGLGGYVDLPTGLINGYYALTIESWVTFNGNAAWARLYDFGSQNANANGGETSIFFTPHTGGNGLEMTMFVPGRNDHISGPGLDNTTNHLVAVYFPAAGYQQLYLNGVLAGENRNITIQLSEINDVLNWIGRSLFPADAYLNASIDEFRIYEGALTVADVSADFNLGPGALPGPKLTVAKNGANIQLTWPTTAGFTLQTASVITGPWTNSGLTVTNQNGQSSVSDAIPTTAGAKFYRLIKTTP
jgi:hypothetical protein